MGDNICDLSEAESQDLKRIFFAQAHEIAEELQDVLMRIEADPTEGAELKVLKRFLHTLKGDANSMGYTALGHLCHRLEDILVAFAELNQLRRREGLGILFSGVDEIKRILVECEAGGEVKAAEELIRAIDRFQAGAAAEPRPVAAQSLTEYQELQIQDAREHGQHVFEVAVRFHPECAEKGVAALMLLDRLAAVAQIIRTDPEIGSEPGEGTENMMLLLVSWLDAEELRREANTAGITAAVSVFTRCEDNGAQPPVEVRPTAAAVQSVRVESVKSEILRVDSDKVDRMLDLVGELIIGRSMLDQIARESEGGGAMEDLSARLLAVNSYLERTVADLHKGVRKMRMVPVRSLFRKFPRMIRDLANTRGKLVRLEVHGEETELDKGIVDALGEPLTHIIRNLVDHGIESPEQRRAAGKPEEGTVTLRAYHEAAQIVIEAADDGRGIDTVKLKRKAVAMGLLGAAEAEKISAGRCRATALSVGSEHRGGRERNLRPRGRHGRGEDRRRGDEGDGRNPVHPGAWRGVSSAPADHAGRDQGAPLRGRFAALRNPRRRDRRSRPGRGRRAENHRRPAGPDLEGRRSFRHRRAGAVPDQGQRGGEEVRAGAQPGRPAHRVAH